MYIQKLEDNISWGLYCIGFGLVLFLTKIGLALDFLTRLAINKEVARNFFKV